MRIVVQHLNIEIDNYNGLGMRSDVVVVYYTKNTPNTSQLCWSMYPNRPRYLGYFLKIALIRRP